ncbi:MAG: DUF2062 domain-containing protein [Desulfuromonadales bacterium]|nr:DUF2062 domain-containing protein [Desulfuromonadales bacterium]
MTNSTPVKRGGRLKKVVSELLQQGLSARQLALAFAVGATIGVLPTLWGTSLLCVIIACRFGLNQVVVQIANYLVYPLQIAFFIPYVELGGLVFSPREFPERLAELSVLLQSVPLDIACQLWLANLQAIAAWLITSPLLLTASYYLSLRLIARLPTKICPPPAQH